MWDKKLDFDEWDKKFRDELEYLESKKKNFGFENKPVPRNKSLHLAYNSILLTQLQNGSRISEAIEGILEFKNNGKREHMIRARKRKKLKKDKKTGEMKVVGRDVLLLIKIPTIIKKNFLDGINDKTPKQIQNGTCLFAMNHYKINTHSLRFSYVAKQGREGVQAHLISKSIRHTNIQTIEEYTQEDQADDIKRRFVK